MEARVGLDGWPDPLRQGLAGQPTCALVQLWEGGDFWGGLDMDKEADPVGLPHLPGLNQLHSDGVLARVQSHEAHLEGSSEFDGRPIAARETISFEFKHDLLSYKGMARDAKVRMLEAEKKKKAKEEAKAAKAAAKAAAEGKAAAADPTSGKTPDEPPAEKTPDEKTPDVPPSEDKTEGEGGAS